MLGLHELLSNVRGGAAFVVATNATIALTIVAALPRRDSVRVLRCMAPLDRRLALPRTLYQLLLPRARAHRYSELAGPTTYDYFGSKKAFSTFSDKSREEQKYVQENLRT